MLTKEYMEQRWLVRWFAMKYPKVLMFAVPNGGYRRPEEARNLKLQGVVSGIPDLMIAEPRGRYAGLFIELKRTPNRQSGKAKVTENQAKMIKHLNSVGYLAFVAYGWAEAQEIIDSYLEYKNTL